MSRGDFYEHHYRVDPKAGGFRLPADVNGGKGWRPKELGLTNTNFRNSTGWPDPAQRMSCRDIATVARRLVQDFPEFYKYDSEKKLSIDTDLVALRIFSRFLDAGHQMGVPVLPVYDTGQSTSIDHTLHDS